MSRICVLCARRLVACNLIMEYTLSSAAIARGFSSYLATLAGLDPTFFVLKVAPETSKPRHKARDE